MRCKDHGRPYCVADKCRKAERDAPYGHTVGIDPNVGTYDDTPTHGGYTDGDTAGDTSGRGSE